MTNYKQLLQIYKTFFTKDDDYISILANTSSLIMQYVDDISFAGFYLIKNGELVVGPFQGKPACMHIKLGKGVCGTSAKELRTVLVPDVHQFEGHISCDIESQSELVIPFFKGNELAGVLDLDSKSLNRFKEDDKLNFEELVNELQKIIC